MKFIPTSLEGSYIIEVEPFNDERGWFTRFYCKKEFSQIGYNGEWKQSNHSTTYKKGTVRGMHFQKKPFQEIKLVKCISGLVYDVIIDLRKESSSFLQWTGIELSEKNKRMIFIPQGFAHGFQCMEDNCELIYQHSEFYTPEFEQGIRFNDPMIDIHWPLPAIYISSKDSSYPLLDKNFKGV